MKFRIPLYYLKQFAYAFGLAYVALLPAFYNTTNVDTRFAIRWNGMDYIGILLAVLGFSLAIWVGYSLVERVLRLFPWRKYIVPMLRWISGIIICYLYLRTTRMILETADALSDLMAILNVRAIRYGLYLGVPLSLGVILQNRFIVFARCLCIFGAILGSIYFITAVTYPRFEVSLQNPSLSQYPVPPGRSGGSMFLLIFDEAAYSRIRPLDALRDDMPHFRAFENESTVYLQCYSEGTETPLSIPRLLLKDDSALRATDARSLMHDINSGKMELKGKSIFTDATNYFRAICGIHVDYEQLLEEDVEQVSTYIFRSRLPLSEKVLRIWLDSFPILARLIYRPIIGETGMFIASVMLAEKWLSEVVERSVEESVFVIAHFALPHYPFVWDAQGLVEERADLPIADLTTALAGYEGNLRYMDAVFGRFIAKLRQAGHYDDSLLIVTSDHAWRVDPALPAYDMSTADADPWSDYKHVPLWIKAPGQTNGFAVDRPIHLRALQPLLTRFTEGKSLQPTLE